jgi:trimeric autotransporter adhesin
MAHRVRHGGTWRNTTQPSIRHGGTWRAATAAWIRHGGIWRQWWPDGPDRGGPYVYGSITSYGHIARWNGSAWAALASGVSSAIGSAAVNDAGQIFASLNGLSSRYWSGSAWSTVQPSYYNTNNAGPVATDGTNFTLGRFSPGSDPVTLWQYLPPSTINALRYLYDATDASITTQAIGQYGGYVTGTFDTPANAPLAYDLVGGDATASLLSSKVMARQLDGNVWTGPAAGGVIACEDGALDTWLQVGGTVTGGDVTAICAWPGAAYVAGSFTAIDGVSCAGIASWDGSAWSQPFTLSNIVGMSYHRGLLWILAGSTPTARKVYTWDGTTLTEHTDWAGDTITNII